MLKAITYFIDERGENPVKEFVDGLTSKNQAKIFAYLDELKKQGHNLHRPMADYLRDGIYELRPKDNRILYFFYLKDNVVSLHAIRKKTNEIPDRDLQICIKRRKQTEITGNIEKLL